jgi:hypothetical protein
MAPNISHPFVLFVGQHATSSRPMSTLTDDLVTEALIAGNGILTDAARYLSDRLGRRVPRGELADRVGASRVLQAVQQIAEQRAAERAIAKGREARRQQRSAAMRESWARRRQGQADAAADLKHLDGLNVGARTRASWALTPADVQAARDMRLCMARTRRGHPCTRRVAPGRDRCVSHGGASTGPRTQAGKERIAAVQRARWQRWRQEHTQ